MSEPVAPTTLANARDIADAAPGLRRHVVFRSDAPLPGDEDPALTPWPPATVIDLRDAHEQAPVHPLSDVATVVEISLFPQAALDVQAQHGRTMPLPEFYLHMISGRTGEDLVTVLGTLATAPTPVLAHCAAGKDRTGVTIAAALALVGVDREAIVADYARTSDNMSGVMARMWHTLPTQEARDAVAALPPEILMAPVEAIEGALDYWESYDGGIEGWFADHGGTPEALAALRTRLLGDQ